MEQDFQQLIDTEKETTQTKWRKQHATMLLLFSVIVFFIEILMYFILTNIGLRHYSFGEYALKFLLVPDLSYVLINVIVIVVNLNQKISKKVKNYVTSIGFSLFCLTICFAHDYFTTIFACGMIAITLTVIYCDIPLTLFCSVFLIIGEAAIGIFGHWDTTVVKNSLYCSYLSVALILLVVITIASIITIKWENQRILFISQKQLQISQLKEQTIIDPLTGLHNRRALRQFIDESTRQITYVMADVDHFKRINDSFGHEIGDDILILLSNILQKYQGTSMKSFRFGGDEFLLTFMDCTLVDIENVCHNIQNDFTKSLSKEILNLDVTISMGIASHKRDELPHEGIQRADNALYVAKVDPDNKIKIV